MNMDFSGFNLKDACFESLDIYSWHIFGAKNIRQECKSKVSFYDYLIYIYVTSPEILSESPEIRSNIWMWNHFLGDSDTALVKLQSKEGECFQRHKEEERVARTEQRQLVPK